MSIVTTAIFTGLVLISFPNNTLVATTNTQELENENYYFSVDYEFKLTKDTKYLLSCEINELVLENENGDEFAYASDLILFEEIDFTLEELNNFNNMYASTSLFEINASSTANGVSINFEIQTETTLSERFNLSGKSIPKSNNTTLNDSVDSYFKVYANDLLQLATTYEALIVQNTNGFNEGVQVGQNNVINNPNNYNLYDQEQYNSYGNQQKDAGYLEGINKNTPTGLEWVQSALNVTTSFLNILIIPPSITLGSILSGFIILIILGWIIDWFRG